MPRPLGSHGSPAPLSGGRSDFGDDHRMPVIDPDTADPAELSEEEYLANYDPTRYHRPSVTVDVVALTIHQGRLSVLLIERAGHPFRGFWALPGGFRDPDESLDAAARRELAEETGVDLDDAHIEQLATFGDPGRDPRGDVISVAYMAFVPDLPLPTAGSDAAAARFWPVEDLEGADAPELAFDHAEIIAAGVERARAKLEYTNLSTFFVSEPFTVADLRRVYEATWGVELHAPNFRRKVTSTPGFITPTGETVNLGRGKPAVLFTRGEATTLAVPILRPDEDGAL